MGQGQKGIKNTESQFSEVSHILTNVAYVLTCPISRLYGSGAVCQEQGRRESDFESTEYWAAFQPAPVWCLSQGHF